MFRLFSIMYALAGPTLAGILVTAVLAMNMINTQSVIVAAAVGFLLGLPVAWLVAKQINDNA
ncbi:MAG: hypothetical protein KDJ82_06515 [Rhodobacteraceae bacterium]|jgi:hypothetical protein|nr:hypothetical protein [Paracoccaceae bacterium]